MKTIANMQGAEFLRQCNKIRHAAADLMQDTQVLEIRKRMPAFTGKESPELRRIMLEKQSKQNVSDMLDTLLDTHAEETYNVLKLMCVLEPGEEPTGLDMAMAGLEIITTPKVMDFLSSLARLAQTDTVG